MEVRLGILLISALLKLIGFHAPATFPLEADWTVDPILKRKIMTCQKLNHGNFKWVSVYSDLKDGVCGVIKL
jgi:hypothetical protein